MNVAPMEETGFLDAFQALVTAELKSDFVGPVRYIVQWKQITTIRSSSAETKWITAAVGYAIGILGIR